MRPFTHTISLAEARAIIDRAVGPIERREPLPLLSALGRVVAADVISSRDVPPFSRAAMDGYAVRAEDTLGASRLEPRVLRRLETVFTGQLPTRYVNARTCTEIATGAPMPEGADSVVMVEDTAAGPPDEVRVFASVQARQNVGRQGADIATGQTVLRAGDVLNPSRIGAAAALGTAAIEVFARPHVAVLSTGNEIAEPGQDLAAGQVYDVNRFTLSSIVAEHGGVPLPQRIAQDTLADLEEALDACLGADLLVFSGGSSVGDRDLILDAMRARGDVLFHGIAVKPGKPTAFGLVDGKPAFGMPGYPTSCLSNAYVLLVPALRRMARLPPNRAARIVLPLSQRILSVTGRHQFYTVRVENGAAVPAFKASGDITSMSLADGYIEIGADTDIVERGEMVEVTLF